MLVGGEFGFGIGSGGPNRHPGLSGYSGFVTPAAEQSRLLPVAVASSAVRLNVPVVGLHPAIPIRVTPVSGTALGSGTPTPLPPK